jgi:serine-type D-Ala-D-Ala carboxypeptidase/endopeptidase (penicillin-binding protein 4)
VTHRGRLGFVVIVALLSAVCAARPMPSAQTREPQTRTRVAPTHPSVVQLRRDLTALFSDPSIDHAQWAVRVDSLATGESLFTYNGHRLMVPASNQKLLTAAVAADRLGWDYRFTTRLLTSGEVDASGTLDADVLVMGDGDPSINPRNPERWRVFDDWGAKLHALGIRVINGHLVGDDRLIDEPGWGEGWSWDDLQYGYGAPASALQYHENQVEVMVGPGIAVGAPAIVITSPLGSGLLVDSSAVTAANDAETTIEVSRLPGTLFLTVRGQIAEGAKPVTTLAAVDNPTHLYVSALREALARHDIFVGGSAIDVDALRTPPPATNLRELIVDRSPPLAEIVDVMLKWSRNGYAETLLTALSALAPPVMPPGLQAVESPSPDAAAVSFVRSAAGGLSVLQSTLNVWGITATAFRSRDGSGLSRMDYVSADGLTRLLTRMWMDPKHREPFRSALPVAGVSGTLAERLKETPAMGRVWAKTGTLSNVRALSGYLDTRAGEPLVFSIIVNNFVVPVAQVDALVDRALLKLIELPTRPVRR